MMIVEEVAIGVRRVVVGKLIAECLDTFFLGTVVVELFLQRCKSVMQSIAMCELVLLLDNVARFQCQITL